jgi:hypothetical protein
LTTDRVHKRLSRLRFSHSLIELALAHLHVFGVKTVAQLGTIAHQCFQVVYAVVDWAIGSTISSVRSGD